MAGKIKLTSYRQAQEDANQAYASDDLGFKCAMDRVGSPAEMKLKAEIITKNKERENYRGK